MANAEEFEVKRLQDIPEGKHFVVLLEERISVADGYGNNEAVRVFKYQVFPNQKAWEQAISAYTISSIPCRALVISPAKVSRTVKVEVDNG